MTMARSRSTRRLNKLDLPYVGASDDRQRQSLVHELSVGENSRQVAPVAGAPQRCARECTGSGMTETSSSGEVDARFEQGDQLDQFLLDWLQVASGERTLELLRGDLRLVKSLRLDQIANRFGLRQVDASIQETRAW